MYSLLLQPK